MNNFDKSLNEMPETLSKYEITDSVINIISGHHDKSLSEKIAILTILADKQYHTYENPEEKTRILVEKWININYKKGNSIQLLLIGSCFCISKSIFLKVLNECKENNKDEFERVALNSNGVYVNPWWDLVK